MKAPVLRSFRADSRTMVRELGFLQERWAPADIPHTQCHVLLELGEAGVMAPSELAERLRSDPAVISRAIRSLTDRGLVQSREDEVDRRRRRLSLTPTGREELGCIHAQADGQVLDALDLLRPAEREEVTRGMRLYAKALRRARLQHGLVVRPIRPSDDPQVTGLIRTVMPEFGANGPGFAILDPEVDGMHAAYRVAGAGYWVIERDGRVLGAGGYARLVGGPDGTCELRKMYFLPELRGAGMGARLLTLVLHAARKAGYERCYLETLEHMTRARALYEAFGFEPLDAPMGATGHHGCDAWYALDLTTA